jgi:hypothetical protein
MAKNSQKNDGKSQTNKEKDNNKKPKTLNLNQFLMKSEYKETS